MIAAIGGVVAMVAGMATGNVPLAVAGVAVVMGAMLAPAMADLRAVNARHEAACQRERAAGANFG
jgi:hypothetical protein